MTAIYLTGPYTVGKTTVGKELARILQYEFLDPDDTITRAHGSHGALAEKVGWRGLVKEWSRIFRRFPTERVVVPIALFGRKKNDDLKKKDADYCKRHGIIVYLLPHAPGEDCSAILYRREKARGYDVTYDDVHARHRYSHPRYLRYADAILIDNGSPKAAARAIAAWLRGKG
jgi:shikimate kinase